MTIEETYRKRTGPTGEELAARQLGWTPSPGDMVWFRLPYWRLGTVRGKHLVGYDVDPLGGCYSMHVSLARLCPVLPDDSS